MDNIFIPVALPPTTNYTYEMMLRSIYVLAFLTSSTGAFLSPATSPELHTLKATTSHDSFVSRRQTFEGLAGAFTASITLPVLAEEDSIFAPKFVQEYEDFVTLPNTVSYRDVTVGKGETAALGDRVVFDWSGFTVGYFGRPFQAKGGPKGGAFDKDLDYDRCVLGSGQMVPGLESAMVGMQPGSVRQVVVPFKPDLSYPMDDLTHDRVGPKPKNFSGQRALNFVLENPRIDRTLLFNVKVVRVDKPNGKGGFTRG